MSPDDPRHGSNAGYIAHFLEGDRKPCEPCKAEHAAYGRRLRAKRYLKRTDRLYVNPIPTQRRLQALSAIGWTWDILNVKLGFGPKTQRVSHMLVAKAVHLDTEAKVKAMFEELHLTPGPSDVTRLRAAKKGWAPPLAWDDIEDLHERPTEFNGIFRGAGLCGNGLHPSRDMKLRADGKRYCPECRNATNARRREARAQSKEMAA